MTDEFKIDLAKVYAMKLLTSLKEFGADDYEYFTEQLREYRKEIIEEEFAKRDSRSPRIDQDFPNLRLTERPQTMEGEIRERPIPRVFGEADSNERIFDNEQEIKEL